MNELSDHSKITTFLKSIPQNDVTDDYNWKKLKPKFKCDDKSRGIFIKNILANQNEIDEISQRIEAGLIESTGEMIQQLFYNAAINAFKPKNAKSQKDWKKKKKSNKKWFDKECNDLKKNVRNLGRKKYNKPHESLLREKYHEKLKEYKRKCKSKKYNFWQNTLTEVEKSLGDPTTFWKKWKNLNESHTSISQPNITGDKWFDYFKNLHTETNNSNIEVDPNSINSKMGNLENKEPFTRKEFEKIIKKLKKEKAEGGDSISNEMIKNSPKAILDLLFNFLNTCFKKSLIPKSWCLDLINPLHKEGNKDDPNNYRGLCISSVLLKIICSLLNNRILIQVKQRNLINKNQTGFKEKHRTADNLLTLKNVVKKYVTIGKGKLYACFVDFKKAYDSVWHEGLYCKMRRNNLQGNLLHLIMDIYKKTKCAVKMGGARTEFFDFSRGVRQGCPLSPMLFNLYVNDIFEVINQNNESNIFLKNEVPINALMYADDLILLSDTPEGLQKHIDKLSKYCDEWKLNINLKKTKIMVFNRGNKLIKSTFSVNKVVLENVKNVKYLGFTINSKNCSFLPTLEDLSIKAKRVIYALNSKTKISRFPIKLALKLFDTLIKPILMYGAEVWGPYIDFDYTKWESSKIEMTHTQFLKRALGCNFHTSNIMTRGEVGARPLLTDVNIKVITYIQNILERQQTTVYSALEFERNNEVSPNIFRYPNKFDLILDENILTGSKRKIRTLCKDNYDRYWQSKIMESPKAISYCKFKYNVSLEKYLYKVKNIRHKIALTRLRLSNHNLLIETGRHLRPKLERHERKCFICRNEIEDEFHFVIKCPLYSCERKALYKSLTNNSNNFELLNSDDQKFMFIMTNEDEVVMAKLAKFTFNSLQLREKVLKIENVYRCFCVRVLVSSL